MKPETRRPEPPDVPPGIVRYEEHDVQASAVAKLLAGLAAAALVTMLVLFPVFRYFNSRMRAGDPPPPPMGAHPAGRLPPEPRLQTRPADDLSAQQRQEAERLRSYGWVDEQAGVVHIPIEEAMRIVAERARGAAPASPAPTASPAAAPSPAGGHR